MVIFLLLTFTLHTRFISNMPPHCISISELNYFYRSSEVYIFICLLLLIRIFLFLHKVSHLEFLVKRICKVFRFPCLINSYCSFNYERHLITADYPWMAYSSQHIEYIVPLTLRPAKFLLENIQIFFLRISCI